MSAGWSQLDLDPWDSLTLDQWAALPLDLVLVYLVSASMYRTGGSAAGQAITTTAQYTTAGSRAGQAVTHDEDAQLTTGHSEAGESI